MLERITSLFSEDGTFPPTYELPSFAHQLREISYPDNGIPSYFLCPISYELMENPVFVNKLQTHTFDEVCLKEAQILSPKYDPFNLKIKSIKENIERKKQIKDFVSSLVRIENLKELISKQQVLLSEVEDEINLIKFIKMKIYLATELQFFINFINKIVNIEDKDRKLEEKLEEINLINQEKIILLQNLNEELKDYQKLTSTFMKIHEYKMTLEDLDFRKQFLPRLMEDLFEDELLKDEIDLLIKDEEKSLAKEIIRTKIKLAEELQLCITLVEIFNSEQSEYKLKNIFKIFTYEINLLITLQADFKESQRDYPDLFYKPEYEFRLFPPQRMTITLMPDTNPTASKRFSYTNE